MAARDIHLDRILILDFGSQYTQLIARRVREIGVYCEIHPWDAEPAAIRAFQPRGIILSGSPESTTAADGPRAPQAIFELPVPLLGICYGMQTLAMQLGGLVEFSEHQEFGYAQVRVHAHSALLRAIEDHASPEGYGLLDVWMSHGDRVTALPPGFVRIASTATCPIAGMANEDKRWYGVQFHPEVTHTRQGARILRRFALDICGCEPLWTTGNIIEDSIAAVRSRVDAESRFLAALAGVTDPEQKRKIIGGLFVEVFEEQAARLRNVTWLAQGTIYPDVIESAGAKTGKAHVIKS
jgi:GMP synthase (glutamine-hydrolysing)